MARKKLRGPSKETCIEFREGPGGHMRDVPISEGKTEINPHLDAEDKREIKKENKRR